MRTIIGIIIAISLTIIMSVPLVYILWPYYIDRMYLLLFSVLAYGIFVPLSVPGVLLLRMFRWKSAYHYLSLGMLTGGIACWIYTDVIPAITFYCEGQYKFEHMLDRMRSFSHLRSDSVVFIFGGIAGFIFWLIVVRRWPSLSGPSSQDKQG